jgi:hypothetical protein
MLSTSYRSLSFRPATALLSEVDIVRVRDSRGSLHCRFRAVMGCIASEPKSYMCQYGGPAGSKIGLWMGNYVIASFGIVPLW